jgi:Ca2+-binding RTX toxin-like protein
VSTVTIEAGPEGTDHAALINSALADPGVTAVVLGAGLFAVATAIVIPSGKSLTGAGSGLTTIKAAADFAPVSAQLNGIVNSEIGAAGVSVAGLTVDASKLLYDGFRLNGVHLKQATDFTVSDVQAVNTTGYGFLAQGQEGGPDDDIVWASGTFTDCAAYNCNVGFEQIYCDGVLLERCVAGDGDGDINTEAYFHALVGARNITYDSCSAYGDSLQGFSLVSSTIPLENIRIINCDIELTRGADGSAIVILGYLPTLNLEIVDSRFVSRGYIAARLGGVTGTVEGSTFEGQVIGIELGASGDGTMSSLVVTNSTTLGLRDPALRAGVYGLDVDPGSLLTWDGGVIEARGAPGLMFPISGQAQSLEGTALIASGFAANLEYFHGADPILLDLPSSLVGEAMGGGSVTVGFQLGGSAGDVIAVRGTGASGIQIDGPTLTHAGLPLGQVSGGMDGVPLTIALSDDATPEAVAALLAAITFATSPDLPLVSHGLYAAIVDASGGVAETNLAIFVFPPNHAPEISGLPAAGAPVGFLEGGPPVAIAPAGEIADVDGRDFKGGTLSITIGGGDGSEGLSIASGAAGMAASSSWQPASRTLTVEFGAGANAAAVQAVLRAIRFQADTETAGPRSLSLSLSDGDGGLSTAEWALAVQTVDDPATATADAFETREDSPVAGNLLLDNGHGADRDPDGPELVIGAVNGSVSAVGQEIALPSGALLTVEADGSYSYDPAGAFDTLADASSGAANGSKIDSFTYSLVGGGTAIVTLNILGVGTGGEDLIGDAGANVITGTAGRDVFLLDQGGADRVEGGGEQDIFYFGAAFTAADLVIGGAGTDRLILQGNYVAGVTFGGPGLANVDGIEQILLLSGRNASFGHATGATYTYSLTMPNAPFPAAARIRVDATDLAAGERLYFDASAVAAGGFVVTGGNGDDRLTGSAAGDSLDGGTGTDRLVGGGGDDVYYVDSWDVVIEEAGGGYDYVYARTSFGLSAGSAVEVLAATDYRLLDKMTLVGNNLNNSIAGNNGVNALYGGAGDDTLRGYGGDDILDGQAGTDFLIGGTGNDIYYVDGLDTAQEDAGEGYDVVYARTSYALTTQSEIEMLATEDYRSTTAISLSGNQLNNYIVANNGDNVLDGRAGDDTLRGLDGNDLLIGGTGGDYLFGGKGNDTYHVDAGDIVEELAGEGDDTVLASDSFALLAGASVELLATLDAGSTAALNLTGNAFSQSIIGNSGANTLLGGGGSDSLNGYIGDDILDGGAGQDYLTGGAGADTFRLSSASHSAVGAADTFADFVSGTDRVDLSPIDANSTTAGDDAFTFIGLAAFSGKAGELRVDGTSGTFIVYGDTDGDGAADFQIVINGPALVSGDFTF